MAHVYESEPDGRQAGDIKPSRFRPRYRALSDDEKALHDELKGKAAELEALFDRVKDGRYKSLAFTELEASLMWIVKELTSAPLDPSLNPRQNAAAAEEIRTSLDQLRLASLSPNTVVSGSPDFVLSCIGTGFTPNTVMKFGDYDEPTTFVSETEVTTIVKPSLFAPAAVPVLVRNGDVLSEPLDFTFTAE
jgi:hypothetical protein